VDVLKEKIAVAEAKRLQIPVFAMVDTNSDPSIDFPIPANDDAAKSIALIMDVVTQAIAEGLEDRKMDRDKEQDDKEVRKNDSRSRKFVAKDEEEEEDVVEEEEEEEIDDEEIDELLGDDEETETSDDDFDEE
jgi:small subunit ribosomal protein S2